VDAERTASLCYERMIALAEQTPELGRDLADDFVRVCEDEKRHARIFEILTESLDNQNRLAPGETDEALATKIAEVGEYFLPRSLRRKMVTQNKIGSGGRVWVFSGEIQEEKCNVFRRLLDLSGLYAASVLRSVTEHHDVTEGSVWTNARSIITHPALEFLWSNVNYHLEHHLYPSVPFHALPELRRARVGIPSSREQGGKWLWPHGCGAPARPAALRHAERELMKPW
jgi:fatty acid desaturase